MENPIKNGWCGGKPAFLGSPPYGGVINPTLTSRDSSTAGSSSKAASCAKTLWRGTGRFQSPWGHAYMILCVFFLAYRDICLQLLQMFHCASHFGNLIHLSIDIPNKTAFALRKLKTSWYRVWEENTQCHLLQSHRQIINMLDQMFLGFLWSVKRLKEHRKPHLHDRWLSHIIYVALKGCIF